MSDAPDLAALERRAAGRAPEYGEDAHIVCDNLVRIYQTQGVDDARLSVGLAGVLGSVIVLLVAGGLTWSLRRRDAGNELSGSAERV